MACFIAMVYALVLNMQKPIGILGGTFDPIHNGHLHFARAVMQECHLAEVRFIPCAHPVHRYQPSASPMDRLHMVQLAIAGESGFIADDRELQRPGPSYMSDTLISLRQQFLHQPLCLLLATDAFSKFDQWHRWREILDYAHLIIVNRPDIPFLPTQLRTEFQQWIKQHQVNDIQLLSNTLQGRIYFSQMTGLAISATAIREQLAHHQILHNSLPKAVWKYIQAKKLYGTL